MWKAALLFSFVYCVLIGFILLAHEIWQKKKLARTSENTPTEIIPDDTYIVNYDHTAGWIKTHVGTGKFVEYNSNTGKVTLEMDYGYLVELDGRYCYPM